MKFLVVTLVVITIIKAAVTKELHPEGEAARLYRVEEDKFPEPADTGFFFDQTNATSVNETRWNMFEDTNSDNAKDIQWFKENIVNKYGFEKMDNRDMWKKQGDFTTKLKDKDFLAAASRAKQFFKRNNDWSKTKSNSEFRKTGQCLELLYITAARYLLVTQILMEVSEGKLTACERDGALNRIPTSVCYPEPYGTASCTSDYDVGLIGKDSGFVTAKFNKYFQDPINGFGKPSELVFDTNIYAFTLEYAMPSIFSGLPTDFESKAEKEESTENYQMQELASSYYKVFKHNGDFAKQLLDTASSNLGASAAGLLKKWNSQIEALNTEVPLKGENVREVHNAKYQTLVEEISKLGGYGAPEKSLAILGQALLYAAEAYHTRGAIRHVVGGTQMKLPQYQASKLPLNDLWVSMIENWGETNKEYNHCKNKILEECLLKMSKYMWRMFAAMKLIRQGISPDKRGGLVAFAGGKDPETMMSYWLDVYKRRGVNKVSSNEGFIKYFFLNLECPNESIGKELSYECMKTINNKVDIFNRKMADPTIEKVDMQKQNKQNDQGNDYYDKFVDEIMQN